MAVVSRTDRWAGRVFPVHLFCLATGVGTRERSVGEPLDSVQGLRRTDDWIGNAVQVAVEILIKEHETVRLIVGFEELALALRRQFEDLAGEGNELGIADFNQLLFEGASIGLVEMHQPREKPPELVPDGLETGEGFGAFLDRRIGDVKLPIEAVDRDFLVDGETLETEEPDKRAAVGEFLVVGDKTDAADIAHRLRLLSRTPVLRGILDHADDPVAFERVAHHGPIPRLEDMQRENLAGEQDHLAQREDGNLVRDVDHPGGMPGEIIGGCRTVHGGLLRQIQHRCIPIVFQSRAPAEPGKVGYRAVEAWMKQLKTAVLLLAAAILAVSVGAEEADETDRETVGGLAFADEVQVTVVNVDVYVRDKKGMPVNGLGPDDFIVTQDGVEMPVSNFAEFDAELIRRRMEEKAMTGPVESEEPTEQAQAPEIKPMWVVLYIDHENLKTLDRNRVLRRVREFVTENLEEPVEMMVVSFQRSLKVVVPFTSESREVSAALRAMAKTSTGREESESTRQELLRAMADAKHQDYGTQNNTQAGAELDLRQRVAAFAAEEAFNLRLAIDGLRQVIAMMSGIDGRKTVVYVSSGLPMVPGIGLMHDHAMTFHDQTILSMRGRYDQTRLFHELTSMANAQEVSLYSIDASGLNPLEGMGADTSYSRDPTASSIGSKNYKDSLVYMAEATGGIAVVNTNDVTGGLERVSSDLYNYYSLGYTVHSNNEDRVHRIKVEIKGDQNYDLRYRRRFVEKSAQSRIQDRVFTSLVVDFDDNPMGLELSGATPVAGSQTQWMVPMHLSIDLSKVALLTLGDDLVGRVVVFIGARDEEGRNTEVQRQEHEISVPRQEYLAAGRERFGIDFRLLLEEGRHRISVGVMDPITRQDSYEKIVVSVP